MQQSMVQKSRYTVYLDGKVVSIDAAAKACGMSYKAFYRRLRSAEMGYGIRQAKTVRAFGEDRTISEWSRIYGTPIGTIIYRLKAGWSAEVAVAGEVLKNGVQDAMTCRCGKVAIAISENGIPLCDNCLLGETHPHPGGNVESDNDIDAATD